MNTLSNGADGKPAKRSRKQQISKRPFSLKPTYSQRFRLYDVGEFIVRQTNQQQKALLEKQMYTTLTVRPNIVKPLLATGGEL